MHKYKRKILSPLVDNIPFGDRCLFAYSLPMINGGIINHTKSPIGFFGNKKKLEQAHQDLLKNLTKTQQAEHSGR